ncbi:hypothetical protein OS493_000989 [Desmophyllum pertusum]|uniref:Uncharacterized protein n=1 Tax=Desmophyllum pertusum TaxID=174260 RepID=A0A9W9ZTK6_9CNID|nr:hypothetical protein OS493_000989 [Desmophyllum pertusum]
MPAYVEDDGDNGDLNGDKQRACDRKGRLYVLPMNLKTERGLNTQYPGSVGKTAVDGNFGSLLRTNKCFGGLAACFFKDSRA